MIAHTYNSNYSAGRNTKFEVQGWPRQKHKTLSEKETKSKNKRGIAQMVEYLWL
jgi:hypothetical protein